MEHRILDLTSQRCPMALLLAKRAYHALMPAQSLQIRLSELGSLHDILRYFQSQAADVRLEQSSSLSILFVVKKEAPHHG